jgi:hypothetical protein
MRSDQFEYMRNAADAPADLRQARGIPGSAPRAPVALVNEGVEQRLGIRPGQGFEAEDPLIRDAQYRLARRHDRQRRHPARERLDEIGGRGGDIFAAIEDQQRLRPPAEPSHDRADRRDGAAQGHAQGLGDGARHTRRFLHRRQIDPMRPVREIVDLAPSQLQGERRFADAAGANDRNQPAGPELLGQPDQFALAAAGRIRSARQRNRRRRRCREHRGRLLGRRHRQNELPALVRDRDDGIPSELVAQDSDIARKRVDIDIDPALGAGDDFFPARDAAGILDQEDEDAEDGLRHRYRRVGFEQHAQTGIEPKPAEKVTELVRPVLRGHPVTRLACFPPSAV